MSTSEILYQLQNSSVAQAISKSDHLVGAGLQVVHIFGFVLLLASLLLIGLRLLGLAFADRPVAQLATGPRRLLWWGLAAAVVSGALMFVASPQLYADKPVFVAKMALVVVAVLLQAALFDRVARRDRPSRAAARTATALSVALWFTIAAAGRAIGFV